MVPGSKIATAALIFAVTIAATALWFRLPEPQNSERKVKEFILPHRPDHREVQIMGDKKSASNSFDGPSRNSAGLPGYRSVREPRSLPSPFQDKKEILWEKVREMLARTLYEKFPNLQLSPGDLQRLTENIRMVHESIQALREIERTRENATQIRNLCGDLEWNVALVQETLGMTVAEFIDRARDEKAIDAAHEELKDEDFAVEYLRNVHP